MQNKKQVQQNVNQKIQKVNVYKSKFKQLQKNKIIEQSQENCDGDSLGQILDESNQNRQKILNQNYLNSISFIKVKASSIHQSLQVENQLLNIKENLKPDINQNRDRDSLQLLDSLQPTPLKVPLAAKINYRQKTKLHMRAKSQYRNSKNRNNSTIKFYTYKDKKQIQNQGQSSRSVNSTKKTNQKSQKKKVRLKANPSNKFEQSQQVLKYKKCIPLHEFQISEEQLFMENTYRLRKNQMKIWEENSSLGKQLLKDFKINSIIAKDNKKIPNQAYDYDGLLLPNQTQVFKPKKHFVQPDVSIKNQENVQNLANYYERHPRFGKTQTKIKQCKRPNEIDDEASPFAKSFQKVKWDAQIKTTPHSPRESDKNTKSKNKLLSKKELQSKQYRTKTLIHARSQSAMGNILLKQRLQKQRQKEDLIEQYQKIRSVQQNQNSKINFNFGFSKYIKVKKFQEKEHKSKSYNSHTAKFIRCTNSFEEEDSIKIKNNFKKGFEKIRANKKLFKKVFNVSMKYIAPQLRQDPPTLKCLKDEMQNQESQRKKKLSKQKNKITRQRNSLSRLERQISIQKTPTKNIKITTWKIDQVNQKNEGCEKMVSQKIQMFQHPKELKMFSKFSLNQSCKKLAKHGKHMLSRQSFNFT